MENREFYIDKDCFKLHAKWDFPKEECDKYHTMILVHGLTGHMEEWHITETARTAVECGYACIRVELYGHGKSDGQFRNHNLFEWVSELSYVIDYVSAQDFVEDIVLAGHSQGGLTTILTAGLKADKLKAIIPMSPALCLIDFCKKGQFFETTFDLDNLPDELWFWEDKCITSNYIRIAQTFDVEPYIKKFNGPVLLPHGTSDGAVPISDSEYAKSIYKNAEIAYIPEDGHCYENHLDLVLEAVANFLNKVK